MHEIDPIALFPQQGADRSSVSNVFGNDKTASVRVMFTHLLQLAPGPDQELLRNAAAIGKMDRPAQIACSPTFTHLFREWRHIAIRLPCTAVLHPTVLEAKFQWSHIARRNQLSRFNAEVRADLFHQLTAFLDPDPSRGTKGEIVGSKGCPCESQPQSSLTAEL